MGDAIPSRRWPRFSLRTLFVVVTAIAMLVGWLGWNAAQVRQRAEFIRSMRDSRAQFARVLNPPSRPPLPYLWSLLGARPVEAIVLVRDKTTEAELQRIERLFPEAVVVYPEPEKKLPPHLPDLPQTREPTRASLHGKLLQLDAQR